MASIIEQPQVDFERIDQVLLSAVVLTALVMVLLAALCACWTMGMRWRRHRRSSLAPGEQAFVARWATGGPELFVVGHAVRRLLPADGCRAEGRRHEAADIGCVWAAGMLQEVLGRRPSRDLVWAFVHDHLAPLPADGFVLPAVDVVAWLDARHAATFDVRSRAAEAAGARVAFIASWFQPAGRRRTADRVHGQRKNP